jgi:hypothetical protein
MCVCLLPPKQLLNACSRRAVLRRERLEKSNARPIPQGTKAGRRRNRKKSRDQYNVAVPKAREIKDVRGTPIGKEKKGGEPVDYSSSPKGKVARVWSSLVTTLLPLSSMMEPYLHSSHIFMTWCWINYAQEPINFPYYLTWGRKQDGMLEVLVWPSTQQINKTDINVLIFFLLQISHVSVYTIIFSWVHKFKTVVTELFLKKMDPYQ